MIQLTENLGIGLNTSGPGWALFRPIKRKKDACIVWTAFKWYASPDQALWSVAERLSANHPPHTIDKLVDKVTQAAVLIEQAHDELRDKVRAA